MILRVFFSSPFFDMYGYMNYLNDSVAREILTNFQACPQGSCFANNVIEARKDLQIIIPAYNAEKYIGECLKSVLCQKTKDSVLATVINDGSILLYLRRKCDFNCYTIQLH